MRSQILKNSGLRKGADWGRRLVFKDLRHDSSYTATESHHTIPLKKQFIFQFRPEALISPRLSVSLLNTIGYAKAEQPRLLVSIFVLNNKSVSFSNTYGGNMEIILAMSFKHNIYKILLATLNNVNFFDISRQNSLRFDLPFLCKVLESVDIKIKKGFDTVLQLLFLGGFLRPLCAPQDWREGFASWN